MGLDKLYKLVRKQIPKRLKIKKKMLEEYRIRRYDGEINSQDFLIKNEFMHDLQTAINMQIERRYRIFSIISAISALIVCIDIIFRLIQIFK